jgi:hypothetical protein
MENDQTPQTFNLMLIRSLSPALAVKFNISPVR